MNGKLHLGHAFSLTKAEFTARFQRMMGKNVLFPFAFHCTGMPIQAATNKLKDELNTFGCPPVFPTVVEEVKPTEAKSAEAVQSTKGKSKKTKLAVKGQSGPTRQWDILKRMVPEEEIKEFVEPRKWLDYFPPIGVQDLELFDTCIDWRRTFITTSVNPFYDTFIRWQFNILKNKVFLNSGFRPNVYSVKDMQVCADHDRSSGEAVVPQEYTLIKLLVIEPFPEGSVLNSVNFTGKKVYLVPATLRPETMYGQTNCFVLPDGEYGAYEFINDEVFIISKRAALDLAHQESALEWGKLKCLLEMTGQQLLGLPLKAPNAVYQIIYTLPLLTISMGKGTTILYL
jgi:leucyl-tRNA synthetase